jgi:S-adenosylmethionine uptake transporter
LLGALCAAGNIVMLRKIGHGAPVPLYGFYAFLVITIFNGSVMAAHGFYKPFEAAYLPYFAVHGPIVVLGLLAISIGFAKAPEAVVVAPFQYTQIIWGVAFGWFFFGALPTTNTWIGLALIIGAGLYSLRREYRRAHHMD